MTDFEKFAHALALTETLNNPQAFGDDGRAYGRWQMHPAFVAEWAPTERDVNETWDGLFRDTLENFYLKRTRAGVPLHILVMEFHLGVHAVASGEWDSKYGLRFAEFYDGEVKT